MKHVGKRLLFAPCAYVNNGLTPTLRLRQAARVCKQRTEISNAFARGLSLAGETIKREGEVVGFLTSTAYGHSVGATVGMVSATAAALRIAAQTLSLR